MDFWKYVRLWLFVVGFCVLLLLCVLRVREEWKKKRALERLLLASILIDLVCALNRDPAAVTYFVIYVLLSCTHTNTHSCMRTNIATFRQMWGRRQVIAVIYSFGRN